MPQEFVNHLGQPINWHAPALKSQPKKKAASTSEPRAMGFRVVGYPAGVIAAAEADTHTLHAEGKSPPWDEARWLRRNKPERISARNYGVRDAADTFAELARRSGWERVQVEEVTRGDVEGARQKLQGAF